MNAGVFGFVCAVRLTVHRGSVGAENVLEGLERLRAKLISVADEQGAAGVARRLRCA